MAAYASQANRALLVIAARRGTALITSAIRSASAVYSDRRPEQDFTRISAEWDSENITRGCRSAGKRLFCRLNRGESSPCTQSGVEKKMPSQCWMSRTSVRLWHRKPRLSEGCFSWMAECCRKLHPPPKKKCPIEAFYTSSGSTGFVCYHHFNQKCDFLSQVT